MLRIMKVTLLAIVVIPQITVQFINPSSLVRDNHETFLISFHGWPREFNFQLLCVNHKNYKLIEMIQTLL